MLSTPALWTVFYKMWLPLCYCIHVTMIIPGWMLLLQNVCTVEAITEHGVPPLPLVLDNAVEEHCPRHVVIVGQVCVEEYSVMSVTKN